MCFWGLTLHCHWAWQRGWRFREGWWGSSLNIKVVLFFTKINPCKIKKRDPDRCVWEVLTCGFTTTTRLMINLSFYEWLLLPKDKMTLGFMYKGCVCKFFHTNLPMYQAWNDRGNVCQPHGWLLWRWWPSAVMLEQLTHMCLCGFNEGNGAENTVYNNSSFGTIRWSCQWSSAQRERVYRECDDFLQPHLEREMARSHVLPVPVCNLKWDQDIFLM